MARKTAQIYQIKVTLDDTHPPIWRRILVPGDSTLSDLHHIVQAVMGWNNSHLHMFTINDTIYGNPEDDEYGELGTKDEKKFKLAKLFPEGGKRFKYEYDFGDSWVHTLLIEKILPPEKGKEYPVCIKGKRACPPEDMGGVWGYEGFLEAISDPNHPEHDEYIEWAGEDFDPEAFDLEEANETLQHPVPDDWFDDEAMFTETLEEMPTLQSSLFDAKLWGELLSPENDAKTENLTLRKDVLSLVAYLRDNKVTGTQVTGNLTRKAVEEIAARFVNPPALEQTLDGHTLRFQNEQEVWPVFFAHLLAESAGLVSGGPGRRWRVTKAGEDFSSLKEVLQVWMLFSGWWLRADWLIAFPFQWMNDSLPVAFKNKVRMLLLEYPPNYTIPFELFADHLIEAAGWRWPIENREHAQFILHSSIDHMVVQPLVEFGAASINTGKVLLDNIEVPGLVSFQLTPFGVGLLKTVFPLPIEL
jgi:hypothetical protein